MKAKTKPARSASPFLMTANEDRKPAAGFTVDFQDLCAQEMDRALGIHKASLDSAVRLHSCAIEFCQAIDIYKQASRFAPVLEAFIDTAAKSFAQCMELHMLCMEVHSSWLALLAPHAFPYERRVASSFASDAAATPEELAFHMDIAIGGQQTVPGELVRGQAGLQAKQVEAAPRARFERAAGARARAA
jgi:hypothetical protein